MIIFNLNLVLCFLYEDFMVLILIKIPLLLII